MVDALGSTAFLIAQWRADEAREPRPLFVDAIAPLFLTPETKALGERVAQAMPAVRTMVRLRTRYLDDLLAAELAAGTTQVLLLGAGLDSRALRFRKPGVAFFEVDRRPVLDFKRRALSEAGHWSGATHVNGDYLQMNLVAELQAAGLDRRKRTLVLWEGNVMYLPPDAVVRVLASLRALASEVVVAFDVLRKKVVERTSGPAQVGALADAFARMGAPWLSGFDDLAALGRDTGFALGETLLMRELAGRYPDAAATDLGVMQGYAMATLSARGPARAAQGDCAPA